MRQIDKLVQAICEYAEDTARTYYNPLIAKGVGISSKIWLTNMSNKQPYATIIEGFIDKDGNIIDMDSLVEFAKEYIDENPLIISNIKFNGKDVQEIYNIYKNK